MPIGSFPTLANPILPLGFPVISQMRQPLVLPSAISEEEPSVVAAVEPSAVATAAPSAVVAAVPSEDTVLVSGAAQHLLDGAVTAQVIDTGIDASSTGTGRPDVQEITVFSGEPNTAAERHAIFQPLRPLSQLPIFRPTSIGATSNARRKVEHDHAEVAPAHDHEHDHNVTDVVTEHALLPDLEPWTPYTQNARVINDRSSGKKLLSFGTTIANKGIGPMELDIGGTKEDERRPAYQLISNDDGTQTKLPVGEFYWHDAPGHNHYHFDEFALYQLRKIGPDGEPGDIAAESHKAGFCLMDSLQSHPDTPNSRITPAFRGTSCEDGTKMGISPGWADHYAARQGLALLDGQFIEIDGVPSGEYYLEIITDPSNRLVESNQENNDVLVKVKI